MGERILITGVAGFIGSHFARLILSERPDWEIVGVDDFSFAGRVENIQDILNHQVKIHRRRKIPPQQFKLIRKDIGSPSLEVPGCTRVVNFAAQTHVDRSIVDPEKFFDSNAYQVGLLLESLRLNLLADNWDGRFLQVGTDEVYGSLGPGGPPFWETSPIRPSSPYSASKAAADFFALSYHTTFGMDVVVTRCGNNYGPNQLSEKLIPRLVDRAQKGENFPIYGTGKNVRDWIFVEDHCRALLLVLEKGRSGEIYNIGAGEEHTNLEIVEQVQKAFSHSKSQIEFVTDRPGHDWRYALNTDKIRTELGFKPMYSFEEGMSRTLRWYKAHPNWAPEPVRNPRDLDVLPKEIWV